jgi:uncharacterized protein (TIGR03086 family)
MSMTTQSDAEALAPRLYQVATTNTRKLMAAVEAGQWHDATPCTDWDVQTLVNHMVSGAKNIASIMGGDGPQNFGDVLGDDALAAFDAAIGPAVAALQEEGAMARTVVGRRGEQPAGDYALGQVQEMLVHGWDLAIAIGQDSTMDSELLEVSYQRALRNRDRLRTGGSTAWGEGEASMGDAPDLQAQYLSLLGRST